MQKLFVLLFSFLFSTSVFSQEVALTFDDSPREDETILTGVERTQKLIDILKKYNIQTVFFSNSHTLDKAKGKERLLAYSQAGHLIANHTHSHPRLSKIGVDEYIKEIDRADELLKNFPTYIKWFRYPFLREGETLTIRDKIRNHLKQQGYINGYITVDNYDYFINDLIQKATAKNEKVNLDRACKMLIDLSLDGLKFYDDLAKKHIGSVRHVLLMHENDLEALCLDKLIGALKKNNWKIVSPTEAFNDPLMKEEPETLYLSQGRIAAIAHVKTGKEFVAKWETVSELQKEFDKRKIVEVKN